MTEVNECTYCLFANRAAVALWNVVGPSWVDDPSPLKPPSLDPCDSDERLEPGILEVGGCCRRYVMIVIDR